MSYAPGAIELRQETPTSAPRGPTLAHEWRKLSRAATFVAVLTSPVFFALLYGRVGWSATGALAATFVAVITFRGLMDVIAHRLIPSPSLYGAEKELLEDDVVARRRLWYWRTRFRRWTWFAGTLFVLLMTLNLAQRIFSTPRSLIDTLTGIGSTVAQFLPGILPLLLIFPFYFLFNALILIGPFLLFAVKQLKGYEPGDADWGVRLEDVRGQAEPKEEVTRVITLWQSGDEFRAAGGKPERGLLFMGAPGTGKTMLSKAIATSFNSPIVTMPGSGFAGVFMGMDVVAVMLMIRKARKLARKWGDQCIVFIDEIDAVGMRRQALGGGGAIGGMMTPNDSFHDYCFYGPNGALTPTGDLVLETRAWRERLFASRAEQPLPVYPPSLQRLGQRIHNFMMPGGMMGGGGMALNQLLVQMDGIDEPKFTKKFFTNKINTFLDATYLIPNKLGNTSLRLPKPKPRTEQIYFIGATNVPLEVLDPALVRPGRMGRHVWFRTPTKDDRKDIFNLYLNKVDHDPDLDSERRRDELARITNGYSPAMIEQVCSMALTLAHSTMRPRFDWADIVGAMTTIESGTAVGIEYVPAETRAVAIHEAGHAVASHVYMEDVLSTRLSIRKRGGSLGHHQAIEKEERFSSWRGEEVGKLVWTLGAMAAERVFYSENSTGVGGDVQSATARAAWMVGMCGMGPERIVLEGRFATFEDEQEQREKLMKRFELIGAQIMNRAGSSSPFGGDPLAAVLADPGKRAAAATLLGQAYLSAEALIRHNRAKVEAIADRLIEARELHGDEVVDLLNSVELEKPEIDLLEESSWPKI